MKKRLIRLVTTACLVVATVTAVGIVDAPSVSADAGNPILGTISGDIVPDASGTGVTVFVRGEWNWLSHNSDCNFDRAATGVGIIWRDPQGTGYPVVKAPINEQVGVKSSNSGNAVDQMVHPVDRGNVPEGYTSGTFQSTTQGYSTNTAGDYPSGQQFVDPSPPNVNSFANWKGGCGREPLSASNSKTSGSTCADGSTACAAHPWGSWGYEKNDGQGHVGYSHHYNSRSDVTTVCANFYDVHGGGKFNSGKMQLVNGAKEITVNSNGDNSIQTNAFNTAQGANCITFPNATPTLTTTATASTTIGQPISDTAHISGLIAPFGGTITFRAYAPAAGGAADTSCSSLVYTSSAVPVSGNGDVTSTPAFIPQSVGTYEWTASYSGFGGNDPVATSCNDAGEQSVVNKAQPTIFTTAQTPVTIGQSISDTATIGGLVNPTGLGTITFTAYAPLANGSADTSCSTLVFTKVVTGISANGNYGSTNFTPSGTSPQIPGVYEWIASFSGDANNLPVSGVCNGTNEQSVVNKAQPSIVTSATSSVTIGGSISDSATISGLVAPTGTGSITFTAYAPLANGSADTNCTTIAATRVITGISANGTYGPTSAFVPSTAGTYEWIASFSGDANNLPVSGVCDATGEKSQVNPTTPTIVTAAAGPIPLGGSISDTATVSGLVSPSGGQLFFRAYAPKADGTADTACGTVAFTSNAVTVNANGQYTSTPLFQPSFAGVYEWRAFYGGDANNVPVATTCDAAGEQSVVNKATPTITTSASGPTTIGGAISDTATLTGLVSPVITGSIIFRAYAPQANGSADTTCSTLVFTSNAVAVNLGNNSYGPATFTPSGSPPQIAGTYEWRAFYSGDANYNAVSTPCNDTNEQSLVNKSTPHCC